MIEDNEPWDDEDMARAAWLTVANMLTDRAQAAWSEYICHLVPETPSMEADVLAQAAWHDYTRAAGRLFTLPGDPRELTRPDYIR